MRLAAALATGIAVVLLLRSTLFAALAVRGVPLDVLVFSTMVWGLRRGASWGASFGFAVGLCADLDGARWLGRHALLLALIGYGVGRLSGTLVRESARTQFVLLSLATASHQLGAALFELGGWAAWPELLYRVVAGSLATGATGALLLWMLRRLMGRPMLDHAPAQPG